MAVDKGAWIGIAIFAVILIAGSITAVVVSKPNSEVKECFQKTIGDNFLGASDTCKEEICGEDPNGPVSFPDLRECFDDVWNDFKKLEDSRDNPEDGRIGHGELCEVRERFYICNTGLICGKGNPDNNFQSTCMTLQECIDSGNTANAFEGSDFCFKGV